MTRSLAPSGSASQRLRSGEEDKTADSRLSVVLLFDPFVFYRRIDRFHDSSYPLGMERKHRKGKEAEPLTYIAWIVAYYAASRPEAFYRDIVEWYQAGYAGLVWSGPVAIGSGSLWGG